MLVTFLFLFAILAGAFGGVLPGASGSSPISIQVTTLKSQTSAINDYVVVEATVTSDGQPVSGASVGFVDSFGSTFTPSTIASNSSGDVLTQMHVARTCGADSINATASKSGYESSTGSTTINIVCGATQLDSTVGVQNTPIASGSSNIISGNVYTCCFNNIGGATVTVTDSIGSHFSTQSSQTDSGGSFSINFTVGAVSSTAYDLITVTAAENGYTQSSSTIFASVNPSNSSYLTVTMNRFLPATLITYQNRPYIGTAVNDYAVVEATVTSGGIVAPGATVSFSDSFGSVFTPLPTTTNSSGVALVQMHVARTCGVDVVAASASLPGHTTGIGSNTMYVNCGAAQLDLTASLQKSSPIVGGSPDVISGNVYTCCFNNIGGATVTVTDSIGSHFTQSSQTDSGGSFSINFTVGAVSSTAYDLITVTATGNGYTQSSSTILIPVTSGGVNGVSEGATNSTTVSTVNGSTVTSVLTSIDVVSAGSTVTSVVTSTITNSSGIDVFGQIDSLFIPLALFVGVFVVALFVLRKRL